MIVGHDRIVSRIVEFGLPPVSLFLGPSSVGKRRLANKLASQSCDVRDILKINRLTAELARDTASFLRTSPLVRGKKRFAVINLDGAPRNHLNTLLKSLEEMTEHSRAILLASRPPIDTIVSRAGEVYSFALLSDPEVAQVLTQRGFSPVEATVRAAESGGQLSEVYAHDETSKLKSQVLIVARCFRERDNAGLEAMASRWTDEHTNLLIQCAHEAATKRYRIFDEAEVEGISGRVWLAILRALKLDVRPRFVIHTQLAGVLRSIS